MKLSHGSLQLMALVISAGFSVQAADWSGVSLGTTYFQPDLSSPFPEADSVVGVGIELPTAAFGFFSVDFSPTSISITSLGDLNLGDGSPAFAGFRFYDANNAAPSLVSAVVGGPLSPGLSYDADSVSINFAGLSLAANSTYVVDLNFESVPEASTYAAGLAVLPALGLWWRRRSARG